MVTLQIWDEPGHEKYQQVSFIGQKVIDNRDSNPIQTLNHRKNLFLKYSNTEDPESFPIFVIKNDFEENDETCKNHLVKQWCQKIESNSFLRYLPKTIQLLMKHSQRLQRYYQNKGKMC